MLIGINEEDLSDGRYKVKVKTHSGAISREFRKKTCLIWFTVLKLRNISINPKKK